MAWYKTGSVALVNGSTAVNGVGTDFVTHVSPGGIFCAPDGHIYEVGSVVSASALTLVIGYAGSTTANAPYAIAPTQSYVVDLAAQASALLNTFGGFRDAYLAGNLVGAGLQLKGVLTDPGLLPASGATGDAYLIGSSLYVWVGTTWKSSSIQGPKGDVGDVNPSNLAAAASALDSKNVATTAASTATAGAASAQTSANSAGTALATSLAARDAASASATAAAGSASAAQGSASSAAGSASSLAAALSFFRSVFLGHFSADPALDGNGNALVAGVEYFNTVSSKLRVYDGSTWGDYDSTAQTATHNAVLSAASAAASASTAGDATTTATTQAGIAVAQANAATTSAGTATAQAGIAIAQANAAASSATVAATQASIATALASTATTAAGTASTQAGIATTQAGAAAGSAATASTQAGVATTQASAAAASAATAATEAGVATTAATSANTSATSAAASATTAGTSRDAAVSAAATATGKASDASASAAIAVQAAQQATAGNLVTSVAGKQGAVQLAATDISGLAAVATTGSYADLSNRPSVDQLAGYVDPIAYALVFGS
ncbi:MAG: hypothetical protein NVSMB28_00100 [Collimonas sp.]